LGGTPLIFSLPKWWDVGEKEFAGDVIALVDEVVDDGVDTVSWPEE